MKKQHVFITVVLFLSFASVAFADFHAGIGLKLDSFLPMDQEMYGERLVNREWAPIIVDKDWSVGRDRQQFYGLNRYSYILGPALVQKFSWDFGLGFEISERFSWLLFAPNSEVDINFSRFMLPIQITPRYQFSFANGRFRPYVGAGVGFYYTITNIGGKDMFNQRINPEFDESDDESDEPEFLTPSREFKMSDWYIGYHATVGMDFYLSDRLALNLGINYETVQIKSLDVILVQDGVDEFHWESEEIEGDGGGVVISLGASYGF